MTGKKSRFFYFLWYYTMQWTLGLIQNIAGSVLWLYYRIRLPRAKRGHYLGALVTDWDKSGSMGLGMFIFYAHRNARDAEEVLLHEYGHTVQSALLGPLLIPVIGIPSLIWGNSAALSQKRVSEKISYYRFYPEYGANRTGLRVFHRHFIDCHPRIKLTREFRDSLPAKMQQAAAEVSGEPHTEVSLKHLP